MKSSFLAVAILSLLGNGTLVVADDIDRKVAAAYAASFVPVEGYHLKVVKKGDAKAEWTSPTNSKGEAFFRDMEPGTYSYGFAHERQSRVITVKANGPNCIRIQANGSPKTNYKTLKKDPKLGFDYISLQAAVEKAPEPLADGPVVGAKIKASNYPNESFAVTDGEGIAVFKGLAGGVYILYHETDSKVMVLSKEKKTHDLRVKVFVKDGKVSIEEEKVEAKVASGSLGGLEVKGMMKGKTFTAQTDGEGIALFQGLTPGVYFFSCGDANNRISLMGQKGPTDVKVKISGEAGKVSITAEAVQ